jgi:hypothetical protein
MNNLDELGLLSRDLGGPSLASLGMALSGDNLAFDKVGSIQNIGGDIDNFTLQCKIVGPIVTDESLPGGKF